MNRCFSHSIRNRVAPLLIALAALPGGMAVLFPSDAAAQAIQRPFPPAARRAIFTVSAPPEVVLNGNVERLSPGARIRGTTNTLVMPASIAGQRLLVNYVRDPQGLVHEVWILTDAEAQERRPGLETVFNFSFRLRRRPAEARRRQDAVQRTAEVPQPIARAAPAALADGGGLQAALGCTARVAGAPRSLFQ